jgi:hypothetical protein
MKKSNFVQSTYHTHHNRLKYSIIRFYTNFTIGIYILVLLNGCNKDDSYVIQNSADNIDLRSQYTSSNEMIDDFYNAFYNKKSVFQSNNLGELSPYSYDLKKASASIPLFLTILL